MSYERVVSVSSTVVESPVGNGGHVGLGGFVGHDCFSVSLFSLCVFCRMIWSWPILVGWSGVLCCGQHEYAFMCALLSNGMSASL